jgi:hypothetical protein
MVVCVVTPQEVPKSRYKKSKGKKKKKKTGVVAHACNYSGGKDWEGCGSRPVQGKVHETPISTNG